MVKERKNYDTRYVGSAQGDRYRISQLINAVLKGDLKRAKILALKQAAKNPEIKEKHHLEFLRKEEAKYRHHVPYGSRGNQDEEKFLEEVGYESDLPEEDKRDMIKAAKIWHHYLTERHKVAQMGGDWEAVSKHEAKKYGLDIEDIETYKSVGWGSGDSDRISRNNMKNLYEAVHRKRTGSSTKDISSRLSSVIAIAGILGGIFFLSPNMTGNAIANVSQNSGNILGAVLLVVGLVAGFFWVKK